LRTLPPGQASAAVIATSAGGEVASLRISEGNHAAVCADLASVVRRDAMRSDIAGAMLRLWQVADMVEAAAWLPAGDYMWTVQLSPVMEVSYRVSEVTTVEDDLVLVA
jgi:hypothetical protein